MPRLGMNVRIMAEKIPGNVMGSVILINVCFGFAPRSAEASSMDFSSFSMVLYIGSTAKGSMLVTKPIRTSPSV